MASNDRADAPLLAESQEEPSYGTQHDAAAEEAQQQGTFARQLTALDGFVVLISIVIGSGIFTSPGSIDANVPAPGAAILVWLVGGVLAWTGANTMAELGTAFPGEGGIQPYLSHMYGEAAGFLAAWTWIVATMPATLAILSIVFVESIYSSLGQNQSADRVEHKVFSILVVLVVAVANSISTKTSTRLGNFFVVIKLLTTVLLIIAGITVAVIFAADHSKDYSGGDWHSKGWFSPRPTLAPDGSTVDWTKLSTWETLGYYSTALYGALWAYSGWDKANYFAAEFSSPNKQLPLAINVAIPTVIVSFVTANLAYYVLLPWSVVSTTDSVAVTAITHVLGRGGGIVAAILICLVVAGSLLGNSFVAGRMTVAAANKNWLPRYLGVVGRLRLPKFRSSNQSQEPESSDEEADDSKGDAPINALIMTTLLSVLYILFGNFRALVTFNGIGEYSFFFLTVLGDVILRWREPDLHRPYKPFIGVPIVFTFVSLFTVVRGAIFAPVQTILLLALWVIGLGFFYARNWRAAERDLRRTD